MEFLEAFTWTNVQFLLEGLLVTIEVAAISIVLSVIIGFILGVVRYYGIPVLSKLLGAVIDIVRNLPLLLIIFFTYFALPQLGIRLNVFWAAIAALTVFESAMISEIVRGGLNALPEGQTEAAYASGLTQNQTMWYVLLPQATRQILPSVVSQLIALIKDTSLATIITLPELTHNARIIYGQDTSYVIPMFIAMALLYFVICYAMSRLSKYLAKRTAIQDQ